MISICILNWNRVETLIQTMKVLHNLKIENEILIFDQNSKDGSVEFIRSLEGVKSILSPVNVGNSISRNELIMMAKYDYVFLLDSDIVPIENSIESLYEFMIKNKSFSFVGYDYRNYSTDPGKIAKFEKGITLKDVETNIRIALTQYGIFRKNDLLKCPFPSFFPFDQEGWGAEDDLVGMAIVDNNLGLTGMITGRTYYHNFTKSSWKYIEGEVHRLYALRYIVYRYFDWFLSPKQKIQVLNTGILPITKLDLIKYHWEFGENWGDVATDWIFKEYFPFFQFTKDSENLLFFGGSIIDHYPNATIKFNKDFKKLYMFGVGIVNNTFGIPNISFEIYPRGYTTERILKNHKINTKAVVGDVLQLLCLLPFTQSPKEKTLIIQDVFDNVVISDNGDTFKISKQIPKINKSVTFMNFFEFLESTKLYSSIISSQIHPYFYYISSGRSAKLIPKDLRADDFYFFSNLNWNSNDQNSLEVRLKMQKNIPIFVDALFTMFKNITRKKNLI